MGWRFWKADKTDAERRLEQLTTVTTPTTSDEADPDDVPEIYVTLRATPTDRTPGAALLVTNEGDTVRVGDRVDLCTSFRAQTTSIVAMSRDGAPVETLDPDEEAELVLTDDADLSEVYRSSCLLDAGFGGSWADGEFLLQIRAWEQRGRDAYLAGPAHGTVPPGTLVTVSPWPGDEWDAAKSTVKGCKVMADGATGLLLADFDSSTVEYGDEATYLPT